MRNNYTLIYNGSWFSTCLILVALFALPLKSLAVNDTLTTSLKGSPNDGGSANYTISGNFRVPSGKATIIFYYQGDLNSGNETVELIDEDNKGYGGENSGTQNCNNLDTSIYLIAQSKVQKWFSDGKVDFTVQAANGVDAGISSCNNSFNAKIEIIYPFTPNPPVAVFNVPDTVCQNQSICLQDESLRGQSRSWYVDGKLESNSANFAYVPGPNTGNQTISLTSSNNNGSDRITKAVYVAKQTSAVADFDVSQSIVDPIGYVGGAGRVQLLDRSKNCPTAWQWYILPKNGSVRYPINPLLNRQCNTVQNTDTAQNPFLEFTQKGVYDVGLKASNSKGSDSTGQDEVIIVRDIAENICKRDTSAFGYGRLFDDGGMGEDYSSNKECSFVLSTCNRTIITFDSFHLAKGDYLRVYDGADASGTPLWDTTSNGMKGFTGQLSDGDVPVRLTAESGHLYFEFDTDVSGTAPGFQLRWFSQPKQFPQPNLSFNGPGSVCAGETVGFNNTSNNEWGKYSWDTIGSSGRSTVARTQDMFVTFGGTGKRTVSLATKTCGGSDTISKQVNVQSPAQAPQPGFYASDRTPYEGYGLNLYDTSGGCTPYIKWEFSKEVSYVEYDSMHPSPRIIPKESGCYEVTLYAGNAIDTVSVTRTCYLDVGCSPIVTTLNSDLGISRFKLGTIDNRTSIGQRGYTDYYRSHVTHIEIGESHPLKLWRNTNSNEMDLKVWVDKDGDSQFTSGEMIASKNGRFTRFIDTLELSSSVTRGAIRLRVGTNLGSLNNTACGANSYGEYEDYRLYVTEDQTAPLIHLDGPDTISLAPCGNIGTLDQNTFAMDNVDGRLSNVQRTGIGSIDASRSGLDSLRYEVTDAKGNTAVKYRYVDIEQDDVPPQASLRGSDSVTLSVYSNYSDAGYTQPSDNCSGVARITPDDNVLPDQLGSYTYSYEITDAAGNSQTLTRHIEVVDQTRPSLTLKGSNPLYLNIGDNFTDPGIANQSDNYWSSSSLDLTQSGAVFTERTDTFTLTYTLRDGSANSTTKSRTVIIRDQEAPTVNTQGLGEGDTLRLEVGQSLSVSGRISATDNAPGALQTSTSGRYFATLDGQGRTSVLGVFEATWTYSDKSGNSTSLTLYAEVVDNEAPVITLKGKETISIPRWSETEYSDISQGATVSDNHGLVSQSTDETSSYFTDYVNDGKRTGYYEIRYEAEDSAGNRAMKRRFVVVNERTTGIEEAESKEQALEAYPNPTSGKLTITLNEATSSDDGRLVITNALGQEVRTVAEGKLSAGTYSLDLSSAESGVYFVKYEESGESIGVERVVLSQ